MTGRELEKYLMSLGLFTTQHAYIVNVVDGKVDGTVPSYYKAQLNYNLLEIKINYCSQVKGHQWVDFTLSKNNLVAVHRLDQLDFHTLKGELNKFFKKDNNFIEWCRDWTIENVIS